MKGSTPLHNGPVLGRTGTDSRLGGGVCQQFRNVQKQLRSWRQGGAIDEESPLIATHSGEKRHSLSEPAMHMEKIDLPKRSASSDNLLTSVDADSSGNSVQMRLPDVMKNFYTKEYRLPRSFVGSASLALRGAMFMLCLAIWKHVHESLVRRSSIDVLIDDYYNGTAVVMFLFTFFRTSGETVSLAWNGVFGTFMGSFLMWILFGIWPQGAATDGSDGAVYTFRQGASLHMTISLVFVWLIFWLNFDLLTKIFASSTFVYLYMMFLNPTTDLTKYSTEFKVKYEGVAVQAFLSTTVGCLLAVVATMLPTPIWATDLAKSHAETLQTLLADAWNASCKWFDASEKQPYQRDLLIASMRKIRESTNSLEDLLAASWWECFGFGRTQRTRMLLTMLDGRIRGCYDRLSLVLLSCTEEDYGESHVQLMYSLGMSLQEVTVTAGECFKFGVNVANNGGLDDEHVEELQRLKKQASDSVDQLTSRFKDEVAKVSEGTELPMLSDLVDEYSVCACACSYCLLAQEFLTDLERLKDGQVPDSFAARHGIKPLSIFDGVCGKQAFLNGFRHTIAIVVAFCIGWHGYSKMIPPYSAGIATTVGILTNDSLVPSVASSINRIVGLVFGTILGWMVWSLLGWCHVGYVIALQGTVTFYVMVCLYVYFASSKYGTMGLLMGAFGAPAMMTSCSNDVFDPKGLYYKISDCSIAIVVVLLFDQLIQIEKPGRYAHELFDKAWRQLQQRVVTLFDPRVTDIEFREVLDEYNLITKNLKDAKYMGAQAEEEPRLWRTSWEDEAFDGAILHAMTLKSTLCALERLVTTRPGEKGSQQSLDHTGVKRKKREVFTHICGMQTFEAIKLIVFQTMHTTRRNLGVFVHEVDAPFLTDKDVQKVDRDYILEARKACARFIQDFTMHTSKDTLKEWNAQENFTLNSDAAALMAVVLTGLKAIVIEVNAIDDLILQI